jgi:hypothetical protein
LAGLGGVLGYKTGAEKERMAGQLDDAGAAFKRFAGENQTAFFQPRSVFRIQFIVAVKSFGDLRLPIGNPSLRSRYNADTELADKPGLAYRAGIDRTGSEVDDGGGGGGIHLSGIGINDTGDVAGIL